MKKNELKAIIIEYSIVEYKNLKNFHFLSIVFSVPFKKNVC